MKLSKAFDNLDHGMFGFQTIFQTENDMLRSTMGDLPV